VGPKQRVARRRIDDLKATFNYGSTCGLRSRVEVIDEFQKGVARWTSFNISIPLFRNTQPL
jgi:hypothetical protein